MTTKTELGPRTEQMKALAKETHRLMHKACTDKGMALVKEDHEDGRIIIATIASFIWAASSSLGGDPIDDTDVAIIRKYLFSTGNVKVLGKMELGNKFRIWVREEWSETALPPKQNGNGAVSGRARAEAKLTPHEAGEDREPEPVKERKYTYMRPERVDLLLTIDKLGTIEDSRGLVSTILGEAIGISGKQVSPAIHDFEQYGWIRRVKPSPKAKRTTRVSITRAGRARAQFYREHGKDVTAEDLMREDPNYQPKIIRNGTKHAEEQTVKVEEEQAVQPAPVEAKAEPIRVGRQPDDVTRMLREVEAEMRSLIDHAAGEKAHEVTILKTKIKAILNSDLTPLNMLVQIEELTS